MRKERIFVDGFIDGAKKLGLEVISDVTNTYLDEEYYKGYDRAAIVCIRHVSHKIGILRKKIKDGKSLSKDEQFLMVQFEDLLKEIEEQLNKSRFVVRAKVVQKDSNNE